MPSLPHVPGKSLITGMTKRTRVVVAAAAGGALAVGGFVVKRVLDHGGEGESESAASADPIAETPTAPPGAEKKPVPKPKAAKPKAARAKPPKPKAAPKPKAKPKAARAPKTTGIDAPPKPEVEPGNQTGGKDPHHALNNPVVDDPDLTEYPDPYDTREDPRDPVDPND